MSEFTVAVLKGAGIRSEVREELIRVVKNGKMLCDVLEKGGGRCISTNV